MTSMHVNVYVALCLCLSGCPAKGKTIEMFRNQFDDLVKMYCDSRAMDETQLTGLYECIYDAFDIDTEAMTVCRKNLFPTPSEDRRYYCNRGSMEEEHVLRKCFVRRMEVKQPGFKLNVRYNETVYLEKVGKMVICSESLVRRL